MNEWREICSAYARKVNAKLLFVNEDSFGIEYPDGTLRHIYVDELVELLGGSYGTC